MKKSLFTELTPSELESLAGGTGRVAIGGGGGGGGGGGNANDDTGRGGRGGTGNSVRVTTLKS